MQEVSDLTETIEVADYYVNYFGRHSLCSASIFFVDKDSEFRGAMWFYDRPDEMPEDELCHDEEGLPYIFGYSTMDHFKNILELVRKEKIALRGNPGFMWIETIK